MTYWRIFAMAIVAVLAFGIPLHASSDYESGKKAWEAGQLSEAPEAIQALLQGMSYAKLQKEREVQEKLKKLYPAGKEFQDCDVCPKMVVVPPGTFLMGSPASEKERDDDEGPQHQVTISIPFAAGKYEVTFREWDACVSNGGCSHRSDDAGWGRGHNTRNSSIDYVLPDRSDDWGWGRGNRPVINVSWDDAQQYVDYVLPDRSDDWGWGRGNRPVINVSWDDAQQYVSWLSRKTGEQYRLLSESEWEYVARAGTTGPFHFGSTISTNQANYDGTSTYGGGLEGIYRKQTVSVGSFPANSFGLHDVHGNVLEWVEDCWHDNYHGAPLDGSAWVTGGDCGRRMLRGGSWIFGPRDMRSADRVRATADYNHYYIGFRVARTLTP